MITVKKVLKQPAVSEVTQKRLFPGKSDTGSLPKKLRVETKARNKSTPSATKTVNIAGKRSIGTQTDLSPAGSELHSNALTIKICLCHPGMPSVNVDNAHAP